MSEPAPSMHGADVTLEDAPCPLGCPAGDQVVLQGEDLLHGLPGTFGVLRCTTCGLMRTSPRPTLEAIGRYYPDLYGPYQPTTGASQPSTEAVPRGAAARAKRALRLDGTRDLLPPIETGRVLEIGCASGGFLRKMRARGWEVQGIEPSSSAASHARAAGIPVHVGPVETAPAPEAPFDLIVASHTLEHLHRPVDCLERMRSWARPGAWLTCSVPDASSLLFRTFKSRWYDLDLPRHLYHFTPESLRALLARTGWRVDSFKPQGTVNSFVGSLGYALRERAGIAGRVGRALVAFPDLQAPWKPLLSPLSWALTGAHQTGRMIAWAQAA